MLVLLRWAHARASIRGTGNRFRLSRFFFIATDSESCRSYRNMRSLPLSQKLFRNAYVNVMRLTDRLVDGYYRLAVARPNSKFSKFVIGRKNVLNDIRRNIDIDSSRKTVWIHSSSFGEFAIARPLISTLADCNIVITFFSPSGYEPTSGSHKFKNTFYLPIDSASNASAFLDIVKPDIALFMVSELWLCYMEELKKRKIPALLISALIRDNSVFFKPYGALHRLMIKQFSHIICLNDRSADNLKKLGVTSYSVIGDPLFDNAYINSRKEYSNPVIERFKGTDRLFVAGSIDTDRDLKLVSSLANTFGDTKFLIVPHTISENVLNRIISSLNGKAVLYSECTDNTDFSDVQTLVVDYFGDLPLLYRYGTWAYVGGGFTRYLHSVIEPVVYGIPVAFGPDIRRKTTPLQLIDAGIGESVGSPAEIRNWFRAIMRDDARLSEIREKAREYVQANLGASRHIVNIISGILDADKC